MVMLISGVLMFLVTLLIQFLLFKFKKDPRFFTGNSIVFVLALFSLLDNDISFASMIMGFVLADEIGRLAKWH